MFTYNVIRKTTYRSRSPGLSTTSSSSSSSDSSSPTSSSQERTDSKSVPVSIECESADEQARDNPSSNTTKIPKHNKDIDHNIYGVTRQFPKYLNSCKNSGWILWMKSSWTQRLIREFFSRIIFRVAEKNCIVQTTQYLYSFLERPNLRNLWEDQNYNGPAQKTYCLNLTSCRIFWWLDNSRSQSPHRRMRISIQSSICQSWCKTWQLSGFNRIRARQKLLRKHKGGCKSPWSWLGNHKNIYTVNSLEFWQSPVKVCRKIIVRRRTHTVQQ